MQTDLFDLPPEPPIRQELKRFAFLEQKKLSLRLDQAVVIFIVFIVFYVLVFSLGVERGKRYALAELLAAKSKGERGSAERSPQQGDQSEDASESQQSMAPVLPPGGENSEAMDEPAAVTVEPPSEKEEALLAVPKGRGPVTGPYTIQLVTYTSKHLAVRQVEELSKRGHQVFLIPSGEFIQVCVDAFPSKAEARRALSRFKANGLAPQDAYVRLFPSNFS